MARMRESRLDLFSGCQQIPDPRLVAIKIANHFQIIDDPLIVAFLCRGGKNIVFSVWIIGQIKKKAARRRIVGGIKIAAILSQQAIHCYLIGSQEDLTAMITGQFLLCAGKQWMPYMCKAISQANDDIRSFGR
jgi:hypothetical protein